MVLKLEESMFIGKGAWKKCYLNPMEKGQCVKIVYRRGGEEEILRELEYREMLRKKRVNAEVFPRYFGTVETNMGTGYLCETVSDSDGKVSRNLTHFLKKPELIDDNFSMLVSVMNKLKLNLNENGIVLMGLNTGNIFIQENCGSYVGRIVDNIGSASLLPLEYYFGYFARARLRRRWKRFMEKILADYPDDRVARLVHAIK